MKSDPVFITHSYRIWFSAPCILYILRHYVTTRRIKYLITTYLSNFVESTVALLTSDNKFKNLNVANILKIMLSPKTVIFPMSFSNRTHSRISHLSVLVCKSFPKRCEWPLALIVFPKYDVAILHSRKIYIHV